MKNMVYRLQNWTASSMLVSDIPKRKELINRVYKEKEKEDA